MAKSSLNGRRVNEKSSSNGQAQAQDANGSLNTSNSSSGNSDGVIRVGSSFQVRIFTVIHKADIFIRPKFKHGIQLNVTNQLRKSGVSLTTMGYAVCGTRQKTGQTGCQPTI